MIISAPVKETDIEILYREVVKKLYIQLFESQEFVVFNKKNSTFNFL